MKQLLQTTEVACHYLTRAAALGGAFALLAGVVLDYPAANAAYDYAALMSVASAACGVISVLERRIMGDLSCITTNEVSAKIAFIGPAIRGSDSDQLVSTRRAAVLRLGPRRPSVDPTDLDRAGYWLATSHEQSRRRPYLPEWRSVR